MNTNEKIIFACFMFFVLTVVTVIVGYTLNDDYEKAEKHLTEPITINNKPYVIIDYSVMGEYYVLDNGTRISFKFYETLKTKKP